MSNVIQSLTHPTKCYKTYNSICQLSCTIISGVKVMITQKKRQLCGEGEENLTLCSSYAFSHGFYFWEFVYWNLGACFQFRGFMWFQCWEKQLSVYGNLCMMIILLYAFWKILWLISNVYRTSTIYDCPWVIYFRVTIGIYVFQKVNIDINDEGLGNCYNRTNFVDWFNCD